MGITAGYKAKLSDTGASTAVTGEACSSVAGQVYQVTSSAKRVLNPSATITVYDNGTDATSHVSAIDAMFGTITFAVGYSITGPVTADFSYYPRAAVAGASKASAKCKANTKDITAINGTGDQALAITTLAATFSASIFDDLRTDLDSTTAGEQSFYTTLANRTPKVLELDFSGNASWVIRAWVVSAEADVETASTDVVTGTMSWASTDKSTGLISAGISFGVP